jgi:hypothetical protein
MTKIREMVTGNIVPTPGAVMKASELLYDNIGDLVTIDVGGATTDVHSVTEGSEEINRMLISPEPKAKRTVEGDLGVYVNAKNIIEGMGEDDLIRKLGVSKEKLDNLISGIKPIPESEDEIKFIEALTEYACVTAIKRHAGSLKNLYGPSGKMTFAEGKDLTSVKYVIGTGGALTRLPHRVEILKNIPHSNNGMELLPNPDVAVLIDNNYIMASLGVMSYRYPDAAIKLLCDSLGINTKGE